MKSSVPEAFAKAFCRNCRTAASQAKPSRSSGRRGDRRRENALLERAALLCARQRERVEKRRFPLGAGLEFALLKVQRGKPPDIASLDAPWRLRDRESTPCVRVRPAGCRSRPAATGNTDAAPARDSYRAARAPIR